MNKSLTPTAHREPHLPGKLQKWQQMPLLSNLKTISHILWEWPHLEGPLWLGPNHWNQLVELHLLLQSVFTLASDVPCSLQPHFICFQLQDPSPLRCPLTHWAQCRRRTSRAKHGRARERWISQRLCCCAEFSQLFLNFYLLLPSSCPLPAPHQHLESAGAPRAGHLRYAGTSPTSTFSWGFLTQGKSCGLERERCYPLVTAKQVILLKPGACCHFPGWKLPLQDAGTDVAAASAGETPSSRQDASQRN